MAYYFQAKQLCVGYQNQPLIQNIEIELKKGEILTLIGPNGAGKSTFLKILCGQLKPTTGEVTIPKNLRMSVLKQDHFAYDAYTVLNTIIMGNQRLYDIMQQKDALYAKEDFSEEEDSYEVITDPDNFSAVREALEKAGIPMVEADITMIPQNWVELTDEEAIKKMQRILDLLDEDDDVQAVYHNWDE